MGRWETLQNPHRPVLSQPELLFVVTDTPAEIVQWGSLIFGANLSLKLSDSSPTVSIVVTQFSVKSG